MELPMQKISTLIYCVNRVNSQSLSEADENIRTEETLKMEPSEASIQNILNFARSYDVLETKQTGYVEMNLN